jgi:hypothetical protein
MASGTDLYITKNRFYWHPGPGQPVLVLEHSVARKGHPILEATPEQWEPLEVTYDVETPKAEAKPAGKKAAGA